ncbi:MAG: hypothetical protein M3O70_08570 [Actinomycetota bacterium]|nr:hypothetical protein [Actinomycetota bacterium]
MGANPTESVRDEIDLTRQRIDMKLDQLADQVPPAETVKKPAALAAAGGVAAGVLVLWVKARIRNRRIRRIAREVIEEVDRERGDGALTT